LLSCINLFLSVPEADPEPATGIFPINSLFVAYLLTGTTLKAALVRKFQLTVNNLIAFGGADVSAPFFKAPLAKLRFNRYMSFSISSKKNCV
jgi:hypothetical protein